MQQFYLAPLRPYKVVISMAVIIAPIAFYVASSSRGHSELNHALHAVRVSLPWLLGWFLILCGDGSLGRVILSPMRLYYVLLGIGLVILSLIRVSPLL